MNQSLSFNVNTVTVIARYLVATPPANAGETAILEILRTTDDSGLYFYGDLSEHGGDISQLDSTNINNIISGSPVSTTIARRAATLLLKINSSPNLSDIINFEFINSTHIRRSIPLTNISLRDIATEFNSTTTNSKIRLYSGGESGVTATTAGVQRSFSEFANKEFKIIKYLANTTSTGANIFTSFTAAELALNNSKKLIANSYTTVGGGINKDAPTAIWNGNVDIVNYGKIKANFGSIAIRTQNNGKLQIVNLGIIQGSGAWGGRGGYGGNSIVNGLLVLGGVGGSPGSGYGYLSPAKKGAAGGTNGSAGVGGLGGNGGISGQSGTSGTVGTDGKDFGSGATIPAPTTGPRSINDGVALAGPLAAINVNNTKISQLGTVTGSIVGASGTVGGVGEILSAAPEISNPYIIPINSIVMVNVADPTYVEWEYYAEADGKLIRGASNQGEIGTTVSATSSNNLAWVIDEGGAHSASPYLPKDSTNQFTGGGIIQDAAAVAGGHIHTVTGLNISGTSAPAKLNRTLLRATTNLTEFPPNSIHINAAQKSSALTRLLATASYNYYLASAKTAPTLTSPTSVTITGTTSSVSSSAHNHDGSSQAYGSADVAPGHAAARSGDITIASHSHGTITATASMTSITGKLISMWLDSMEGVPYADDIIMYCGDLGLLPSYWKVCDGANGTTDMRNYFLGYNVNNGITVTSTVSTISSVSVPSSGAWTHSHISEVESYSTRQYAVNFGHKIYSPSHIHTASLTGTLNDIPAHIKLAFIQFKP